MDAAMRGRTTQGRFIPETMDVDVAVERIYLSTAIVSGFQAIQPEDAMHDRGLGLALPDGTDRFAAAKYCSDKTTNLFGDAMKA